MVLGATCIIKLPFKPPAIHKFKNSGIKKIPLNLWCKITYLIIMSVLCDFHV